MSETLAARAQTILQDWIQSESLRDLVPRPAEARGGAGANQMRELVGAEREAAIGIHLPHEAHEVAARRGR